MKLVAQGSTLDLSHPHVMGILNVTPDSFSDGGAHNSLVEAVKHANLMINAGATIIDIGGESTRPGAAEVSVEEELARVIPVVEAIAQRFEVWISVDTSKPEVIRESARAGAHIINDIRSLTEPGALQAAAETGLPVCLMHMQGQPKPCRRRRNMRMSSPMSSAFLQNILCAASRRGSQKKNCCSTRDSVSVKISPIIINCWPGWVNFTTLGCLCWSVCRVSRW
ncbi:dihydropteroate synthase [Klebsiella variicola subsp. variicola]|nr:dihydropteroate synthase [Klebsiella variicola subsp. variicola]